MKQMDLFDYLERQKKKKKKQKKINGVPVYCHVKNLIGRRFNRLLVVGYAGSRNGAAHWVCLCDCGNSTVVAASNLKRCYVKSCGCLAKEAGPWNKGLKRHTNFIDRTGHRVKTWTVIKSAGIDNKGENLWILECFYCRETIVRRGSLIKSTPACKCVAEARNKQKANDFYCYYSKTECLKKTANMVGYSKSTVMRCLLEYCEQYKEASRRRRAKSKYNETCLSNGIISAKYKNEAEFQEAIKNKLLLENIPFEEQLLMNSLRSDIVTPECIIELKITVRKQDLSKALGQLKIMGKGTQKQLVFCYPSDCKPDDECLLHFRQIGPEICTEKNILEVISSV